MVIEIKLTQGYVTVIDDIDSDLADFKWYALKAKTNFYAARRIKENTILLHRVILNRMIERELIDGEQCDHINCNELDNRRVNLRVCNHAENNRNKSITISNTSGYKGVSWSKKTNKWRADIMVNSQHIYLGLFDDPKEAYAAYCEAALKYFGEFARFE